VSEYSFRRRVGGTTIMNTNKRKIYNPTTSLELKAMNPVKKKVEED